MDINVDILRSMFNIFNGVSGILSKSYRFSLNLFPTNQLI